MTDENERPDENATDTPITATEGAPCMAVDVRAHRLTFITEGVAVHLKLEDMCKVAVMEKNPLPVLLYGVILKLNDVDVSLRKAVAISERADARQTAVGEDPAAVVGKIFGPIVDGLRDLGLQVPGAPAPKPPAGTNGG